MRPKKLNDTMRKIRETRKKARWLRSTFQDDKAKVALLNQKGTIAKMIKNIQHYEETRETFRKIRWYIDPEKRQKTSFIEVPDDQGWRKVTYDEENMELLNLEAKRHFTQASNTTFFTEGMDDTLR